MKKLLLVLLISLFLISLGYAQDKSENLQKIVDSATNQTIEKFAAKSLKPENIAVTVIDVNKSEMASFRGEEKIYPASVVKMFYLVAVHRWLEDKKIKDTPELRRTMKDMIVDSSNDATGIIVDILAGVGSGGELPEKEFKKWAYKRNVVNRYFASLGYQNINVCQKAFCEDAYGLEQQFRGKDGINRNKLTTNATAKLMSQIAMNKAVTADRSKQMMDLMQRNWEGEVKDPEDQTHGFTGMALKELNLKGAKLWSKAGWTSTTRHDVAYIELPNGKKYVICIFTEKFAYERNILPNIGKLILQGLSEVK